MENNIYGLDIDDRVAQLAIMANIQYEPELKNKILRLHSEEGRTKKVLQKNTILVKVHYIKAFEHKYDHGNSWFYDTVFNRMPIMDILILATRGDGNEWI